MRKILLIFFSLIFYQWTVAQDTTIIGKVMNISKNIPIAHANISVKGYPIGVSTNVEGEFEFHIPNRHFSDTLSASSIGFESYECQIDSIENPDSLIINLSEQIYDLESVIVIPKDELERIIKKVTNSIRKNYPKRKYLLNGFYREMVLNDNTYTRLIEAAVDIQRQGTNNPEYDKIRIVELRKSDSYVEYDWKSKLFTKTYGESNNLYRVLHSDIVNYHESFIKKDILTANFLAVYDFVLENITLIDSVKVYKIRFYDKIYYGEYGGNFSMINNHWIYVREDNFAIIKYEYKYQIVKNTKENQIVNFEDNCFLAHTVHYKEYKGKYYPYLIDYMSLVHAKYADKETGKGKQYMKATLLINNINTKYSEYDRVKEKFSSPQDIDLYNQDYKYNSEFWENYNILQLNPLYKQVNKDLEKENSLEKQFINNGK